MVVGDPAIGDLRSPPNDYQRGATFETFYPHPCPVCGCTLTERACIDLYIHDGWQLHIQVMILHPAGIHAGNSMGCYWSVPVNGQATALVGPIVNRVANGSQPRDET